MCNKLQYFSQVICSESILLCKNSFVLGQLEENGGDFDLVEIWKNSSETRQKQFKKFLPTFLSS